MRGLSRNSYPTQPRTGSDLCRGLTHKPGQRLSDDSRLRVLVTATEFGADVSAIDPALFTLTLGDDAALIPRTAAIAEAYQALLEINSERLAHWFPGFANPPTPDATRFELEKRGRAWLEGSQLPLAIAIRDGDTWRLAGAVTLLIDGSAQSGEVGYWIDAGFEGRGLVTRAVTAVLDQAFGPLGLHRVELRTNPTNNRSRSVPHRLGFTQEASCVKQLLFPTSGVMKWSTASWQANGLRQRTDVVGLPRTCHGSAERLRRPGREPTKEHGGFDQVVTSGLVGGVRSSGLQASLLKSISETRAVTAPSS